MEIKEIVNLVMQDISHALMLSIDKHLPEDCNFDVFSDIYLSVCVNMMANSISKINRITPLDMRQTLRGCFYKMQIKLIGNPNGEKMH